MILGRPGGVGIATRSAVLAPSLSLWMVAGACWPFVVAVTAPILLADLGIGAGRFGVTVAPYYVIGAVLSGQAGRLVDGWPVRWSGWLLAGLIAASLLVLAAAQGPVSLAASGLLGGISLALTNPLTNRIAAQQHVANWVVGVKQSGVPTAAALSGAVLPWLATTMGWRMAVISVLVLPLAAVMADLAVKHQGNLAPDSRSRRELPTSGGLGRDKVGPWTIRLAAYAGLMGIAGGAVNVYLALYVVQELGGTPAAAGAVVSLLAVFGIVARIVWAGLGPGRLGAARIMVGLALAGAAGTGWLAVADLVTVWMAAGLAGASIMAWQGVGMLTIVRGTEAVGKASAQVMRAFYAGFALGPLSYGGLTSVTGPRLAWAFPTFAALLAAAAVAGTARRRG